ncbi:MAG: DegT/DnrJ/EryC1/StrS family aminotransferase [Bacteroidetes bacterium]|nr:DegT/DnrJ/EryC1/StrS family aminotransferase [Bacteroidota bacterium]
MKRRDFFKLGGMLAAASTLHANPISLLKSSPVQKPNSGVNFLGEGLDLTPADFVEILMRMVEEGKIKPDYYSNGGIVEELEEKFAKHLGKECAVFFPTGTLANQIAIRKLALGKKRAIVQAESHIYNDCGDCVQTLSNINLVPLGAEQASFTLAEVEAVIKKTASGRVKAPIGVISIESPVRRKTGEVFGFEEIKRISDYARANDIKMHMDGARLFAEAGHTGRKPSDYSPYFDTIYTSLYKCFSSGSGAMLAGTKEFCEDLYHTRRMFGGGLPNVWPFAAIAINYVDNYIEEYKAARIKAEVLFEYLNKNTDLTITHIPNGTNLYQVRANEGDLTEIAIKLSKQNVLMRSPRAGSNETLLAINPSLNNMTSEKLKEVFAYALKH